MVWPFSSSKKQDSKKDEPIDLLNTPIVPDQGPSPSSSEPSPYAPPRKTYNPYEGMVQIDSRAMNRIYYIPESPDLLFADDQKTKRKGWGDNLAYYTGFGCLAGFAVGALKGGVEALRSKAPVPGLEGSTRLTFNRVLNMGGEQGKRASMALACLGLLFSMAEGGAGYVGDNYVSVDYPELLNSVVGGFATGALYRAPRGPKAAAITGLVGAAAGAVARPMLDRNTL